MFTKTSIPQAGSATTEPRFRGRAIRRLATLAATLATMAVGAGLIAPGANAHAVFSDRTSADHAMACYSQGGGISVNGSRSVASGSWVQIVGHASSSGIWARMRTFDRVTSRWTNFGSFVPMKVGVETSIAWGQFLTGTYTFEIQYAKQVLGTWQYRSQYVRVFQATYPAINENVLINDHSITNLVCAQ